MTTQDQAFKWLCYALGVVPVWLTETLILSRVPLLGVVPVLLPLAVIAAAQWEGEGFGALFGLCVGVVADATYPGIPGGMTLGLCLLGWLTGAMSQYGVQRNFLGYLLCSTLGMGLLELARLGWCLLTKLGALEVVGLVALKEGLWSLCFVVLIYPLFKGIHRRVGPQRMGG